MIENNNDKSNDLWEEIDKERGLPATRTARNDETIDDHKSRVEHFNAYVNQEEKISYLEYQLNQANIKLKAYKLLEDANLKERALEEFRLLKEKEKDSLIQSEEPTPPLLTRGAHPQFNSQNDIKNRVFIDWISFTSKECFNVLKDFALIINPNIQFIPQSKGITGYKTVTQMVYQGKNIGLIAGGSSHLRNLFTFTGQGSKLVEDWRIFHYWLLKLEEPAITRIDLSLDFYSGEVTHDIVENAYNNGKFTALKSSKLPKINMHIGKDSQGRNTGRTIYIGAKKSGKMIRCYEKGLEQYGKLFQMNEDDRDLIIRTYDCSDIDDRCPMGTLIENWYRLEVQYGNADRELDFSMLLDRDSYFSGAYPFCKDLLQNTEEAKPIRKPQKFESDIQIKINHCSNSYGSLFYTLRCLGWTDKEIVDAVSNGKMCQKILTSGGLPYVKPYTPND